MPDSNRWLFFQLGAREHYVLPRSFHQRGELTALFTDAWIDPRSLWHTALSFSPRLLSRYDPHLSSARVERFTGSLLRFEAGRALKSRANPWDHIVARNNWFQQQAVRRLNETGLLARSDRGRGIVHAYSYAAHDILTVAKSAGHLTVLAQIDPGPTEEDLVHQACLQHAEFHPKWTPAPREYWDDWHEECQLADIIVVNSDWSRRGLVGKGISSEKIVTIPLMFETADLVSPASKTFPDRLDSSNPLTVLFLGTLCIRKGIAEMLEAAELLRDAPVRFWFVGESEVRLPEFARANPNVQWFGAMPRDKVHEFYRDSHLFVLPTLSDGFALTQLEAQAYGLPVIASRNCGEVVQDGENGLLLPEVSGTCVAQAIETILKSPDRLPAMSLRSREAAKEFSGARVLPKYASAVRHLKDQTDDPS